MNISFGNISLESVRSRVLQKAFLQGMAGVGAFYFLLGAYSLIFSTDPEQEAISAVPPRLYSVERTVAQAESASHPGNIGSAHLPPGETAATGGGLFEDTAEGPIPRKSLEGETPFAAYRKSYTPQNGHPVIALAVMDYGLSESDSKEALDKLPENISFIVNPYADNLPRWQADARAQGRELWLYVPSENEGFPHKDPGPRGLLANLDSAGNKERLHWLMAQTKEYAGVALDTDGTLLGSRMAIQKIVDDIFDRGLGYMDINENAPSFFEVNAIGRNAPYAKNQGTIGAGEGDASIFANLEKQARDNGSAVFIMRLHPQSLKTVSEWAATLKGKGIELAPVSFVARIEQHPVE
ncbi:MAG: divergent polysaccharide deacetylase family protein [Alphaproteobacteria bacterium]